MRCRTCETKDRRFKRLNCGRNIAPWDAYETTFDPNFVSLPSARTLSYLVAMGRFHVGYKVENHVHRDRSATVHRALVDTGSEYTWIPAKTLESIGVVREKKDLAFTMATGQTITRSVGFAILRVDRHFTIDEVVFGEPEDMTLLGARTLEGLSLVVDSRKKKLVPAGPLPAASDQALPYARTLSI